MKIIKTFIAFIGALLVGFGFISCANGVENNNSNAENPNENTTLEVAPGTLGKSSDVLLSASNLAKQLDPNDEEVILFYYREDGNYKPWGLWLWPDGGDGQSAYSDTDGKFIKDSATGLGYLILNEDLLTTATDCYACIRDNKKLNFIIRDSNWGKDPDADRFFDLESGNKHFLCISSDKGVYSVTEDISPEIITAYLEESNKMFIQTSVTYGLKETPDNNGFELKCEDGTSINIIDAINYNNQVDRTKNNADKILLTLDTVIDPTKKWTISHKEFGSKEVITTSAVYIVLSDYLYNEDDLGLTLNGTQAGFKIWAPTAKEVQLILYENVNNIGTYNNEAVEKNVAGATTDETLLGTPITGYPKTMTKNQDGIWSLSDIDISGAKYYKYKISVEDKSYYVCDINAKVASPDSIAAQIVDINKAEEAKPMGTTEVFDGTTNSYKNPFIGTRYNDAVIYEMHIRDWSRAVVADSTGKFLDIANSDKIINHLKDLGITHVQILPMFDYAQVNSDTNYNWGYNPYHYNVPEGRYVDYTSNPDGTAAVSQMRTMIAKLHDAGISVIMDVVFNHTSGTGAGSLYDSTIPYYYYRMNKDGTYSNGSGCGNETNSSAPMFQKYMIDSLKHWMLNYHINGFRFDLMGLHEKETMTKIYEELSKIDPKVLVYGEPWNGGTNLCKNATVEAIPINTSGIGAFDDTYRNAIKGAEFGGFKVGQIQGSIETQSEKIKINNEIIDSLLGNSGRNFSNISGLSLHYVECHDNFTLYDKLVYSLDENLSGAQTADKGGNIATAWPTTPINETQLAKIKQQTKLAGAYIFLAQGTPFINGGQEFLRTKKGNPDSYSADKKGGIVWTNEPGNYNIDDVNTIDLSFKDTYSDVYNVYKGLIALRKSSDAFTNPTNCEASSEKNSLTNKDVTGFVKYVCNSSNDSYVIYFNGSKSTCFAKSPVSGIKIDISDGTIKELSNISKDTNIGIDGTSFVIIKVTE